MAIDMSYLAYSGNAPQTTVGQEQDIVRDMALANPAERTATAANVGGGFGGAYTAESPLGYEGSDDKPAISAHIADNYNPTGQSAMTGGATSGVSAMNTQQGMGYAPSVLPVALSRNTSPTVQQYANLGLATMGTATHALNLAGDFFGNNFLKDVSGTLGKIGMAGSLLLNAYQIATGDVKGGVTGLAQTGIMQGIKEAGTKAGQAALTSALGNAGTTLGSLAAGVSIAAPWYAAAKLGGVVANAVVNNNPSLQDKPIGLLAHGLDEPLNVEGGTGNWLADRGVGNYETNKLISNLANPIGGAMVAAQAGDWGGVAEAVGPHLAVPAAIAAPATALTAVPFVAPLLAPLLPFAGLIGALFGKKSDPYADYQHALSQQLHMQMQMPYIEHQWEIAKWKQEQAEKQQALNANNPQYQRAMSGMF